VRVSVLLQVAVFLAAAVKWTWLAAQVVAILMGVWALVDSLLRPTQYYVAAGKNTKRFWTVVNAVGTVVVGVLGAASMLGLLGVVASAVYLVDVRPALQALAALQAPVDAFFEQVMVNAEDPALRRNRLALLGGLHALMNRVADLSQL